MRFGFLGHNGAGKSTTLKSLTSIIEPTSGKISFDGLDLAQHRTEIKHESNYNVGFAIIVALLTLIFYLGSIFILTSLLTFLITQNRIFQTHKQIGNSLLLGVSTLAIVIGCIPPSITKNEPHTTDQTVLSPLKPIFQLITQPFSATSLITLLVLIGITTGGMFILNKLSNSGLLQIKSSYTKKRKTPAHPVVQKSLGKTLIR